VTQYFPILCIFLKFSHFNTATHTISYLIGRFAVWRHSLSRPLLRASVFAKLLRLTIRSLTRSRRARSSIEMTIAGQIDDEVTWIVISTASIRGRGGRKYAFEHEISALEKSQITVHLLLENRSQSRHIRRVFWQTPMPPPLELSAPISQTSLKLCEV